MVITDLKQIKTGDSCLVSTKSWLANKIQFFQKLEDKEGGIYNHAMMFWWAYDELMVIEADKRGISITPFKHYYQNPEKYDLLLLQPIFDVDGSEYGKFMLPYCGHTRYDYWNLFIAQSVKLLTGGRIWLGERKENDKKFICGEWCGFVYNHFNPYVIKEEIQKLAPVDLYLNKNFIHYKIKITE